MNDLEQMIHDVYEALLPPGEALAASDAAVVEGICEALHALGYVRPPM